ncbi:hypothetical protein INT47_003231 [Mucor saturninus]|uniref:DH domain-containing protein n=1 Tax=Mucor saturninus TaxID=64648 RepID=A0A8H7V4W0_9FUNG|nr:hypothetical protein INT47_003231 [Mucor saturninus]
MKKRLEVWGPTQIISDLLDAFKSKLSIYDQFMENHPKFVMLLDALYKLPGFKKFMYATLGDNSDKKEMMDGLLHYIHTPLHRLNAYIRSLKHIIRYSDRSHPDYSSLLSVSGNFKSLEKKLSGKVNRCQSHLIALESILSIVDCPLLLTMNLRLLLFAQLIKIDLDDPSATSDVRMYFLYNDTLIFCKKAKEKKGGEKKLEYKETINLSATTVRLLSPEYLAKMCEVKKPMFRIGKKTAETIAPVHNEAFGFELVTTEINVSGMAVPQMEYDGNGLLNGITSKRRHAIRTRSLIEQNIWVEAIYKAIRAAKSPIS